MQIQKANLVNFGQVKYEFERPSMAKTPNQRKALDEIETELFVADVERKLEDKKAADLIIKFRLDGNIDMFVKKGLPSVYPEAKESYTPYTSNGKEKLVAEFNLKPGASKKTFNTALKSFIQKTLKYISAPDCAKNNEIESKAEEKLEKTLDRLAKAGRLQDTLMSCFNDIE